MITVDMLEDLLRKHKWENIDLYDGEVGGEKHVGKGRDLLANKEDYVVFIDLDTVSEGDEVLVTIEFHDSSRTSFKDIAYLKRQLNLEKKAKMSIEEVDAYLYKIDSYLNQKYNMNESMKIKRIKRLIESLNEREIEQLNKLMEGAPVTTQYKVGDIVGNTVYGFDMEVINIDSNPYVTVKNLITGKISKIWFESIYKPKETNPKIKKENT